jgi:hypothetical protein
LSIHQPEAREMNVCVWRGGEHSRASTCASTCARKGNKTQQNCSSILSQGNECMCGSIQGLPPVQGGRGKADRAELLNLPSIRRHLDWCYQGAECCLCFQHVMMMMKDRKVNVVGDGGGGSTAQCRAGVIVAFYTCRIDGPTHHQAVLRSQLSCGYEKLRDQVPGYMHNSRTPGPSQHPHLPVLATRPKFDTQLTPPPLPSPEHRHQEGVHLHAALQQAHSSPEVALL